MVINEIVILKPSSNHLEYYRNLGYNVKYLEPIEISYKDLTPNSRVLIKIECDKCHTKSEKQFRGLNIGKNGEYVCGKCTASEHFKKIITPEVRKSNIKKIANTKKEKELNDSNYWSKIITKQKKTKLERYGNEIYTNHTKRHKTMFNRYGKLSGVNDKKKKNTCLDRHDNPTFNNQTKKKQTCLEKYGTEHSSQNPNVFNKIQKSTYQIRKHKLTGLDYQGTYEKDFLDFCYQHGIAIERGLNFKYKYKGKNKIYYSDFYHRPTNTIIEIKSTYTYSADLKKNLAKERSVIKAGYNFIFIINKLYDNFMGLINQSHAMGI
jgi:hypothetical protein